MTRILVSHRLASMAQCDRVLVIEDGTLAQAGSYAGLADQDGPFRRLLGEQGLRGAA